MKKTHPFCLLFLLLVLASPARIFAQLSFSVSVSSVTVPIESQTSGIAVGDLNLDGKPDLVTLAQGVTGPNLAIIQLSNGKGGFTPAGGYLTGVGSSGVVIGDFNGDHKPDLAVSNSSSKDISILLGAGDGAFTAPTSVPAGTAVRGLVTADFNGDGNLDLAVAAPDTNRVLVLLGNGNGTFKPGVTYATGQSPIAVLLADLNGDGTLDLVTVDQLAGGISVLIGNGDGTFQTSTPIPTGQFPSSAAVGDFNRDGKQDLAVVDSTGLSVLIGKGDGTFQSPQHYPVSPRSVVAADLNGDGVLDLMVSTPGAANNLVYFQGNGDGTFLAAGTVFGGNQPGNLAIGDFNTDGLPDLAVGDAAAPGPGGPAQAVYFSVLVNSTTTATTRTISHIADGSSFRTTIILVNTGLVPANFTLNFWTETGAPLPLDLGADGTAATLSGVIPPGGTRFVRTVGASAALNKGWAQLIAPPAIDGNSIFGLQSPGQGDSEAAVPLSPAGGTDLFLPFDNTTGHFTGVAFADPSATAATIAGAFKDDSGNPIVDGNTVPVPAKGHVSELLGTLYPATQGKRGAAHLTAGQTIFGLGIRANGKAFTTIEALSGVPVIEKTIAHIASGGGWKTTFLLVNTGTAAASFRLTFISDTGHLLTLPLASGGTASRVVNSIPPGGLQVVEVVNSGDLVTGWADLGVTGNISGTAIFALETAGQADSEAAVPFLLDRMAATGGSTQLYMPYDYSPGYSTAMALTSGNPLPAKVTVSFADEAGHSLSTGTVVTIPPFGHVSIVLGVLFPGIAGTRGTVSLSSNVPIFGLGIRANGAAFTSLKVIAR